MSNLESKRPWIDRPKPASRATFARAGLQTAAVIKANLFRMPINVKMSFIQSYDHLCIPFYTFTDTRRA